MIDDLPEITAALSSDQLKALNEILQKEAPNGFQVWGIPSGAKSVLKNLRRNDWLLLLLSDGPGGSFYYGGRVIFRPDQEMFDVSHRLWGEAKFPLIVLLIGKLTSFPWETFRTSFAYQENWRLAGMTYRLTHERIALSQFPTESDVIRAIIGPIEPTETSDAIFADVLDQVKLLQETLEGRKSLREHLIRERDAGLIRKFKNGLRSYKCFICNFDFEENYRTIGKAFIEAHHVSPIGSRDEESVTRVNDLIAVCSNCHRMLHRQSPPFTSAQIAEALTQSFERKHNKSRGGLTEPVPKQPVRNG
jgi:5-methylcytosine-specific restriction enzyme A